MMKIAVFAALTLFSVFGFAEDDDDDFLENEPAETVRRAVPNGDAATKESSEAESVRKCYKCLGKGATTVSMRENCSRCDGTGYIEVEVELKDTVNGRYYWDSNYRTTRKVVSKKPCPQCGRRGKLPVKKDMPCKKCQGSGYLTKSGKPARLPGVEMAEKAPQVVEKQPPRESNAEEPPKPSQMSLADRIRANSQVSVGPMEIESKTGRGWAEFDFRSNGGRFTIRGKGTEFSTLWLPGNPRMVRVNRSGVEAVGYKPNVRYMPQDQNELETFDWSRPMVEVSVGTVVAFMNKAGRFVVVRVCDIKDRKFGAEVDRLHIEFTIY